MPTAEHDELIAIKRPLVHVLRSRMDAQHVSVSELARTLRTHRTVVRRILDPRNTSITLQTMARAARALGLTLKLAADPMPPEQLDELAQRLAHAESDSEASQLTESIVAGFYGR